jgi:two-component system response regulator AtoC
VESELFGHERGAFTGAVERKLGRLEMADAGTIVLDEVAALSPATQSKLLRVLEERQFERLGGTETITIQARLIALTNSDLPRLVAEGQFREDLFFRLSVLTIAVPSLRARSADILPLADALLERAARVHGRTGTLFSEPVRLMLAAYGWPGNVRELKNSIERALVFSAGPILAPQDFPESVQAGDSGLGVALRSLEDMERDAIRATLEATHYKIGKSATILGISRKTLLDKRKKYGLN